MLPYRLCVDALITHRTYWNAKIFFDFLLFGIKLWNTKFGADRTIFDSYSRKWFNFFHDFSILNSSSVLLVYFTMRSERTIWIYYSIIHQNWASCSRNIVKVKGIRHLHWIFVILQTLSLWLWCISWISASILINCYDIKISCDFLS